MPLLVSWSPDSAGVMYWARRPSDGTAGYHRETISSRTLTPAAQGSGREVSVSHNDVVPAGHGPVGSGRYGACPRATGAPPASAEGPMPPIITGRPRPRHPESRAFGPGRPAAVSRSLSEAGWRRERPAEPALTREGIVDTALRPSSTRTRLRASRARPPRSPTRSGGHSASRPSPSFPPSPCHTSATTPPITKRSSTRAIHETRARGYLVHAPWPAGRAGL